jgi:hypothetical protein
MAFDWNLLTSALGAGVSMIPGVGPLGGLATGVLQGLTDAFGISDGGGSSLQGPETQAALDKLGQIQQMASYTSTGAEGAAANRESAEAARRFIGQQTADSRRAQMQQQALGSQALGGAQATTDLARSAAMMNLGNQRRDLMQQAAAAGGSPAALAGVAGNLGQANTQTLTNLAQQGADAQQRAIQTAGQAFSESERVRQQDLAQQLQNFQPYALQKFGGTTAGALGQLGQYQQTVAQTQAMEDPLALLKQMGGKGANLLQNQPFEQATFEEMLARALGRYGQSQPTTKVPVQTSVGVGYVNR